MARCRVCGEDCRTDEYVRGMCLDCAACIEEEKMRRRRAVEVEKIMGNPLYWMKKKWELSKVKRVMFNLLDPEGVCDGKVH